MPFLFFLITILSAGLVAGEVKHELISGRLGKVEIFWEKPAGAGPFPAVIFVHGHQGGEKKGASIYTKSDLFSRTVGENRVAIAVSQSGYGSSTGKPDNCGIYSQTALKEAIAFGRKQKFVDPKKIIILGYSMGASLSAIIASQDYKLAGAVLIAGIYDQEDALLKIGFQSFSNPGMKSLYDDLGQEIGSEKDRFIIRSALYHAEKIKVPVLILTGGGDQIATVDQSIRLHEKIKASGGNSKLLIFPFSGHYIHPLLSWLEISKFMNQHL